MSEPADPHDQPPEPSDDALGYGAALAELEGILRDLDADNVDVDVLGARVRRAAELLALCRDRISKARFDVEQVVAQLDQSNEPDPSGGSSVGPDSG